MKNIKNDIQILLNLFNVNKYNSVISKSKKLIREFPEYLILYNLLGSAYQNVGKMNLAKEIFKKGLTLEPNNISIMNNLGNVYKNIGDLVSAEKLLNKIIKQKPDYVNAYINLGNLKRDSNDFQSAINLYSEALKINNDIPITHYSLALAYQGLGDFKKAIDHAEKTLTFDPKFTQADLLISQSIKYKIGNKHFDQMNSKIDNLQLNNDQKVNLLFALAKAHEDLSQIKESFEKLDLGNKIKRSLITFDIKNEIKFFNKTKKIFSNIGNKIVSEDINSSKTIIFILGMPRSGTSLVEQIITSHSNVFGAGELPQLSKIIKENLIIDNEISEQKINELINDDFVINRLRKIYYDYLERFESNKKFITDKAPLNFRWIGLIKILFPHSKIIHCTRNPKDNCFSLFKNYFEGGLNFSYNQRELGAYYNLYLDLMNYWHDLFPASIYEANYEKIINNPKNEINKIIDFCSLEWEDECMQFHKNKTPIKTMSTAQARRPIYKTSINSYEKFSLFLEDLNKNL
jgi:tetratricopeptide (TPR) repeat protein